MKFTDKKNVPYYILVLILFIVLKSIYKFSDVNDLQFLLAPTSKLVSLTGNSPSVFIPNTGYFHESMNIIINKSCSGFNFWILCYTLLLFSIIERLQNFYQRFYTFFLLFLGSYLLTILVNSSRILLSVVINKFFIQYEFTTEWMHQALGTFVYLFFLISVYLLFNYIVTYISIPSKLMKNEKFT